MGQRHQAFLIARISLRNESGYYRCVAALHHQWCYGRLPLRATRRFITLAKQPVNAEIIREELRKIGEYETNKDMPSRYLASMLALAWNCGFEEEHPYVSGSNEPKDSFLPASMDCWDGDNNDGLSIIDITDPEHCAYAFLPGYETGEHQSRNTILDARSYARCYYPAEENTEGQAIEDSEEEKDVRFVIDSLAQEPLITLSTLYATWPQEFQKAIRRANIAVNVDPPTGPVAEHATIIPPLSELALLPAIKQSLAKDDTEDIENLLWMPGKAKTIIELLKSAEFNPFPDSAVSLLKKALDQGFKTDELDLSHFHLTTAQILMIIEERRDVVVLKLSHNPNVRIGTVQAILPCLPHLKRLVLLGTGIGQKEWRKLFRKSPALFYHLEGLIHPSFIDMTKAFYQAAFVFVARGHRFDGDSSASIPFFTPAVIVQALVQFFGSEEFIEDIMFHRSSMAQSAAARWILSSDLLDLTRSWGQRSIPFFAPPIGHSFNGDGWLFAYLKEENVLGFIKAERAAPGDDTGAENVGFSVRVFDLGGFLAEMEKEGRPEASPEAVRLLADTFSKLTDGSRKEQTRLSWITEERARVLIASL